MSTTEERNADSLKVMTHIAQNVMNLSLRGFVESYRSAKPGKLIHDSEWCRVSLIWGGWDALEGNSINVRYGRLHAPSEKVTMPWGGEDCRCWHRVEHALHFLDGRTAAETAKLDYTHTLITAFYEDETRKKFFRRQPEWLAQIHVAIWQDYGKRLFELFDLRRPDLWEQYRQFLKQVYDIQGRNPVIKPSMDKVC
jgi:hypothetical protein